MTELVNTFATSQERAEILRGLLRYRAALGSLGITGGFQLMDGSFVEECEKQRGRPPSDIDLVTFAHRPTSDLGAWKALLAANQQLFNPLVTKNSFRCDAYFVDLDIPPAKVVQQTFYWWGLFSHQKSTALWKGVVVVNLASDDAAAARLL